MMVVGDSQGNWALQLFRESLRTSRPIPFLDVASASSEDTGLPVPTDPEKLQYLRDLTTTLLDGRRIVPTYNLVLLGALVLFALLHIGQKLSQSARCKAIEQDLQVAVDQIPGKSVTHGVNETEIYSSSSSTLEGSLSPDPTPKVADDDIDVERQPLLRNRPQRASKAKRNGFLKTTQALLMYQPRPIPVINRTMPSNDTSLFVLAFLGLNTFYHLYKFPFEARYLFAFADRAGLIFVANLPLLYLLAAKNQPLKLLTGRSYEALNIYHRRVGELLCFEALLHFAGILIWHEFISPPWLRRGDFRHFITHPIILLGLGAFVSYEVLYFTSLGSFRQRWYEVFLVSHVVLQVAALAFLWLHFPTSRPYVYASLAIFLVDRLVWRLGLKSATFDTDLTVLEDGQTLLLSADWDIPQNHSRKCGGVFSRQSILHGWRPADHVFVSIPHLGGGHALQAHPFTIASAAPASTSAPSNIPQHAWLNLLIRAQSGFTSDLLRHARSNSTVPVRLEGPYGSQDPLSTLRSCDTAVLITGGSGIAVAFPLLWDLATTHRGKRQIHLFWVTRSQAQQRSWIPEDRMTELRSFGVHLVLPEPTEEAGRPDVPGYVAEVTAAAADGRVGVVVSGPDALNRIARNACAAAVRSGADVRLRVEKFGW
ncbi:hypothetical protein F4779DRAFT_599380 [Xylariaceae sp. FL0662B]|nr:hypothetical protein F4779DRAFT_599380 [Xylariaceae sp. FL0662B]